MYICRSFLVSFVRVDFNVACSAVSLSSLTVRAFSLLSPDIVFIQPSTDSMQLKDAKIKHNSQYNEKIIPIR